MGSVTLCVHAYLCSGIPCTPSSVYAVHHEADIGTHRRCRARHPRPRRRPRCDHEAVRRLGETWGRRAEGADWESRVFALLADFLDFALGSPHLYTFLMTEPRERTRRFPGDFAGGASPAFTHLVVLVEEGMRSGRLRGDDPLEVTLALTAAVQGLVQLHLGGRIGLAEEEFRELCRRTVRRVLDGLLA
ncbi:TetR-like C-terminal domain-containing protein [Nonomuraea rhodomycinica]|uniref:TetR-like C-terminal domain-containing protein n=1 Tax=Nonomuraea rhodomycinica TaxID=1712872 RepID=UPI0028B18AA6|nr:TetR-like C-terminal domain-containing protein [Nonomuraea rhodomycinica]